MLHKVANIVEETFGKADVVTKQTDGMERSNKPTKEYEKFRLAFELIEALPQEYDNTREDLVMNVTNYMYNPIIFYDDWVKEAEKKATNKGHVVLFKEKILPPLTQAKFSNNTAGVLTSEARSKFMEHWSKMELKEEEDNNRKKEILEAVEPKIGNEPSKPIIEMEEVKKIIGNIRLCWIFSN